LFSLATEKRLLALKQVEITRTPQNKCSMSSIKNIEKLLVNQLYLESERHQIHSIFILSKFLSESSMLNHLIKNYKVGVL
jgi:hypothetical protein